ncbi:DUF1168-domain-containing protein [Fistulina hepatica ATCC 64428]|uniref:DUF1168-domain-containing protein n=1 Tax=Fistulina hepatica ATCC 64428 TaxID=1128425 RepID=A0A0D7AQC5_9AGAR|nr:DUF1168-domain-containing protein [Fistulina hepatica ATCC 64428]
MPGEYTTASSSAAPAKRYALSAVEKQRAQLSKLLKDTTKPVYIPPPPKEKIIRPAREMMKNVQGSSAGAGSGEFHVYKASRRREYERLKLLEDQMKKEAVEAEFEKRKAEHEAAADAKTAKNRAKRQKKKERAKDKGSAAKSEDVGSTDADAPIKKRRLVNGQQLVFKKPGEESDADDDDESVGPLPPPQGKPLPATDVAPAQLPVADAANVVIHDEE